MTHADTLGDRMKAYEAAESGRRFMPLLPIYARIDGRCFSKFTRGMERPYDRELSETMRGVTRFLIEETHATVGYTQSDEISLCWRNDNPESEMLFGGKPFKFMSILAGLASARFNQEWISRDMVRTIRYTPTFDARVFQLPNLIEAANAFLWRVNDAVKNSTTMAASAFYSHAELQGKSGPEKHEMLYAKGINWNDYPAFFKEGSFFRRISTERPFYDFELARIPEKHRAKLPDLIVRHSVEEMDWAPFKEHLNKQQLLFDDINPIK